MRHGLELPRRMTARRMLTTRTPLFTRAAELAEEAGDHSAARWHWDATAKAREAATNARRLADEDRRDPSAGPQSSVTTVRTAESPAPRTRFAHRSARR